MVLSKALFPNPKGFPDQGLCFGEVASIFEYVREVIEANTDKLMSWLAMSPVNCKGFPPFCPSARRTSPTAAPSATTVTVAQARLGRRVGNLSAARMEEVSQALRFALGCG